MTTIGDRIRNLRLSKRLTQEEVGKHIGTSKQTLYKYEVGIIRNIPFDKVDALARLLDVSPVYLMGWDDEETPTGNGILIPIVGSIPAGVPIEDIEDIVDSVLIPEEWTKHGDEFFALRVSGDSMHPLFFDGDTAIIKRQAHANTGDVCVCYVNGHDYATIKRIKLSEHAITLQPENSNYSPATYTHPGEVSIAGKVVEMRRKI